jgi:hypothetical protein
MECWICEHGVRTSAEEVGTCAVCQIFACDAHGDRPTKGRFWCFVCLQRVALNAAGEPDLVTPAAIDAAPMGQPLRPLTGPEMSILSSRLELEVTQIDMVGSPGPEHGWELAHTLAERCAGSLDRNDLQEHERKYDVIDPRLIERLRLR